MPEYNKMKFLNNVAYLMKQNNVKVGELETAAGVSAGYFSRLKNNDKDDVCPGIETLSSIANVLKCTLNTLLYCDFTSLTETELFIQKFLTEMIDRTNKRELEWEKETIKSVFNGANYNGSHPLIRTGSSYNGGEISLYQSEFTDDFCELDKSIFVLRRVNQRFYITYIKHFHEDGRTFNYAYELYLYKDNKIQKICNADKGSKEEFTNLLKDLYESADVSAKALKIDSTVKKGIEDFFSGEDDKLPF